MKNWESQTGGDQNFRGKAGLDSHRALYSEVKRQKPRYLARHGNGEVKSSPANFPSPSLKISNAINQVKKLGKQRGGQEARAKSRQDTPLSMFSIPFLLNFLSTLVQKIKIFALSLIMSENLKNNEEREELRSTARETDPFNPLSPSTPISYPIKTLEALESRSYFESFHYPFNSASISLQTKQGDLPNRPRILVCHDMQGGYVDDKWVQGGDNPDAYAIWHWYLMDVFVYFSHNLVTLPPPCWTNAAHRHGVRVNMLR